MTYTKETSLRGVSKGSPEDWSAYADTMGAHRSDDVVLFASAVYDACIPLHLRAEVVMGIYALATNKWRSYVWNTRCNPYGSWCGKQSADKNFGSGTRAGRAVMVNTWLLVSGRELPKELSGYRHLDMLWENVISSDRDGSIKTIGELSEHFDINWDAIDNILNEDLPFIIKEQEQ